MVRNNKNFECFPEISNSQRTVCTPPKSSVVIRVREHRKRLTKHEKVVVSAITYASKILKQGFVRCPNSAELLAAIPQELRNRDACTSGERVMFIPYGSEERSWETGFCEGNWFVNQNNNSVKEKWVVVRRSTSTMRQHIGLKTPIVALPQENVFRCPRYFRP